MREHDEAAPPSDPQRQKGSTMSLHDDVTGGNAPADEIRDAAWNAVAIASLAYQQEVIALSRMLSCAQGHGMTVDDLVYASGLDAAFVTRLLAEVA